MQGIQNICVFLNQNSSSGDRCSNNPCNNDGMCTAESNLLGYSCNCTSEFVGFDCSLLKGAIVIT